MDQTRTAAYGITGLAFSYYPCPSFKKKKKDEYKGIKKRVRPGFGKCQGTFCEEEVIKILARELHKNLNEICYSDLGTEIMRYDVKGAKND